MYRKTWSSLGQHCKLDLQVMDMGEIQAKKIERIQYI